MKQKTLAEELGISQQSISHIEQSEALEDYKLARVAKALEVSKENFSEEKLIYNIQNNYEGSNPGATSVSVANFDCNFNPLDKLVEAYEENKKLYECLVQAEKDKVLYLEKLMDK